MHALITGLVLGMASGLIPGPLQALVISESAQHGWRSGLVVALAPLVTDGFIVVITTWLFSHVPPWTLHGMTVLGALMVAYIGLDAWRAARAAGDQGVQVASGAPAPAVNDAASGDTAGGRADEAPHRGRGLWQSVIVNILNPHAWLFWVVVGAPLFVRFGHISAWQAALFVLSFYVVMIGTKVGLAIGIDRGVSWSGPRGQMWILRVTSLALGVLALVMLVTGLSEIIG